MILLAASINQPSHHAGRYNVCLKNAQSPLTCPKIARGQGLPSSRARHPSVACHGEPSCRWLGKTPAAAKRKLQATTSMMQFQVAFLTMRCFWTRQSGKRVSDLELQLRTFIERTSTTWVRSLFKGVPSPQRPTEMTSSVPT